ncbi:MAG: hypothetical protein Q7J26_09105, partial [Brevundimonas sp.]|uniref:hypothetical protein n=1 Tax=Brevundimonas sp. TaxID=1871086 RepID=UPI00271EB066
MRALQAMVMLLGALAVLMTSAVPAMAMPGDASPPPCHEKAAAHGEASSPSTDSGKAMKAMDCCVACVAAPVLHPPARCRVAAPRPMATASLTSAA